MTDEDVFVTDQEKRAYEALLAYADKGRLVTERSPTDRTRPTLIERVFGPDLALELEHNPGMSPAQRVGDALRRVAVSGGPLLTHAAREQLIAAVERLPVSAPAGAKELELEADLQTDAERFTSSVLADARLGELCTHALGFSSEAERREYEQGLSDATRHDILSVSREGREAKDLEVWERVMCNEQGEFVETAADAAKAPFVLVADYLRALELSGLYATHHARAWLMQRVRLVREERNAIV